MLNWIGRMMLWVLAGLCPVAAHAQVIHIEAVRTPLEEALQQLRNQASVDLVYAERLVRGRTASCRYEGHQPFEALECLLVGTGLRAERVRYRQYVLVAPVQGSAVIDAAPRGALSGFVRDAETGEMLPGAHVYLPDLRAGAVTNAAGYFALTALPCGEYAVRFSFVGYRAQQAMMQACTPSVTVRLQPVTLEAEVVVVESGRDGEGGVPGLVTASVQQLEQLPSFPGEQDLFQAVQWFPGVRKSGEVNGGLVVRGGQPDQNLYLLDGAPVYHPWHAFSLISTFQTETFKDIKLYRGSFPAEYGGRLAGVLDAQMKDGGRSGPRAVAALSTMSGRFLIETPVTRGSSFMVSGRRSYLDKLLGREHPVREGLHRDTLRTGYYFFDMSAKFTVHADPRHRFTLSYYKGGDDLDLRLPFDLSLDFSSWLRPADLFFEIKQRWTNQLLSARYQYLYGQRLFVTTTLYQAAYRASERSLIRPTSTTALASDYAVRIYDHGVRVDADYYYSLSHHLQAGVHIADHRFQGRLDAALQHAPSTIDTLMQASRQRAVEAAAYVQDVWRPAPRLQLQPGLRATFFSSGAHLNLNPRFSAQYALYPDRLWVRLAAGGQVQYMQHLRDRYSFLYDLVSSRWIPAGDHVPPSTSVQLALETEARPADGVALQADVYWRRSDDILLPEDVFQTKSGLEGPGIETGTLLGQYTSGEGRAYGAELSARLERGPWQSWVSYEASRTLSRAPELGETGFSPARFDAPHAVRAFVQRSNARWDAGLAVEWRSGYPWSVPVARYRLGDPLDPVPLPYLYRPQVNNGRLPPYFRLDVVVARRFRMLGAAWQAQLHLFNVTNRRNVIGWQYDPAPEVVEARPRRGLPILPLIDLKMEL